jgi:hypothetical protein
MNPEEIKLDSERHAADEALTADDLASIAVDPSQAPPEVSYLEGSGPLSALMAFVVFVAGVGKKLQMVMQAGHEERMNSITLAKAVAAEAARVATAVQSEAEAIEAAREQLSGLLPAHADAPAEEPAAAAQAPCACAENQADIDGLKKRLKALENWRKKGIKSV